MTYTDFWPKQVIVEERYSETERGMVPNSRAAAATPATPTATTERHTFSIFAMFTRRRECLIDIYKKNKIQY